MNVANVQSDPFSTQRINQQRKWFWAGVFADGIRKAREATGRSIEETAKLAGMETSEWEAIEAAFILPQTEDRMQAMAGALEVDFIRLAKFILHCRLAWEN